MGLFGGAETLVGLDVGASSIKIIAGKMAKSVFEVERFIAVPLPFESIDERGVVNRDAVSSALRTGIGELSRNTRIASAVGGQNVLTKRVVIPKIPKKEIPDQVRWEAEQVFPQDVANILIDYLELGVGAQVPGAPTGTEGWELLLVGVRQEEAESLRDLVESAKGRLNLLDLDAFAISDFLKSRLELPADGACGFVDVGASGTRVSILLRGNVVFVREFAVGGNAFTNAIAQALGVSFQDAEALKIQNGEGIPSEAQTAIQQMASSWVNDLQQCEDLFVSQDSNVLVSRWFVFGGAVQTPGFMDYVRSERVGEKIVPLPCHDLLSAKGKKVDSALLAAWAPRLMTAVGLGCRKG